MKKIPNKDSLKTFHMTKSLRYLLHAEFHYTYIHHVKSQRHHLL